MKLIRAVESTYGRLVSFDADKVVRIDDRPPKGDQKQHTILIWPDDYNGELTFKGRQAKALSDYFNLLLAEDFSSLKEDNDEGKH